jgi:hypothetical protein
LGSEKSEIYSKLEDCLERLEKLQKSGDPAKKNTETRPRFPCRWQQKMSSLCGSVQNSFLLRRENLINQISFK